jgi:hypothetical protein
MSAKNRILGFLRIPYFDAERRFAYGVAFQTHHRCRERDSIALRTAAVRALALRDPALTDY